MQASSYFDRPQPFLKPFQLVIVLFRFVVQRSKVWDSRVANEQMPHTSRIGKFLLDMGEKLTAPPNLIRMSFLVCPITHTPSASKRIYLRPENPFGAAPAAQLLAKQLL